MSDIMEVMEADCIVEDRSRFAANVAKDVESPESCYRYVAAYGVGDVSAPLPTTQGENHETDSMMQDSASSLSYDNSRHRLRGSRLPWAAAARAGTMQQ